MQTVTRHNDRRNKNVSDVADVTDRPYRWNNLNSVLNRKPQTMLVYGSFCRQL